MSDSGSAAAAPGEPSREGGVALKFGISVGVLSGVSLIAIWLFVFFIRRRRTDVRNEETASASTDEDRDSDTVLELGVGGLDEAALEAYPKLLYLQQAKSAYAVSSCSICLADYADGETLRVLPHCDHIFHAECVDTWLKRHAACPICRQSPLSVPEDKIPIQD